jgi:hypothetical protein
MFHNFEHGQDRFCVGTVNPHAWSAAEEAAAH